MTVTDYATGDVIEGATVCNTSNEGCSTSNAEGIAEFEYALGTDILVTVDAEIYFGAQLNAQLTPNEDESPNTLAVALVQRAAAELVVSTAPEPVDITNAEVGHIIVWSATPSGTFLPGSSFSIEPTSGKGPFYFAEGNIVTNVTNGAAYNAEVTATTANGVAQFVELEPGEYTMNIAHEGRTCISTYGLENGDNSLKLNIAADRLTYVLFTCDGPEPYQVDINLTDFATSVALEGATVCSVEFSACADTDAEGNVSVPYARNVDNTFTFAKENYFSASTSYTATNILNNDFVDGIDSIATTMIETAQVEVIVPQAPGAPSVEEGTAGLVAQVWDRSGNSVAGLSVSLDPQSGVGPLYFAEGNLLANAGAGEAFDADATATTSNGFLTYVNVEPGIYTVSFAHDSLTCVPGAGLAADTENSITLVASPDALTYFSVYCFDLTTLQPSNVTLVDGSTGNPIEGATVCPMSDVADAECYTTDANGNAAVMYEPGVDHVATASADGYMTARSSYNIVPAEDGTIASLTQQLLGTTVIETVVTQADGVEAVDPTKGHLAIFVGNGRGSPVAGVSFAVTPMSGVGPQYFAEGNLLVNTASGMAYDNEATATTSNGFANVINADPGSYTLTATHESATCIAFQGIQNEDGTVGFDIAAGELSYVLLTCTE
ncbi:MAG: hypothetical protein ACPGQS_08110 [Bradymonadia bacterium]